MANMKKKGGPTTPKKVSRAADFKAPGSELELPSGNVVKVRRPKGLTAFLAGGTIPNSLMPLMKQALDGKAPEAMDLNSILNDGSQLAGIMSMADSITVATVIEPKFSLPPEREEDRSDDIVYTDEIEDDDKFFIMSFAMAGTKDIEQFRAEQAATMADMADVASVPEPPVSATSD